MVGAADVARSQQGRQLLQAPCRAEAPCGGRETGTATVSQSGAISRFVIVSGVSACCLCALVSAVAWLVCEA